MLDNKFLLILAIAVIIFLILNCNSKPVSVQRQALDVQDSEIPMSEHFVDEPAPSNVVENQVNASLVPKIDITNGGEVNTDEDLASFYEENLKGLENNYEVKGKPNSNLVDNYNQEYTLGVNVNDKSYKSLGGATDTNKLISDDLLPKKAEDWFENPSVGNNVEDANLLADATFRGGINSTHSTRKGMNLDIRGNIPNPKINVSPWGQSSREPSGGVGLCV